MNLNYNLMRIIIFVVGSYIIVEAEAYWGHSFDLMQPLAKPTQSNWKNADLDILQIGY